MRAAIYARISTLDKGQAAELQLQPLRDYCGARGFRIAGEYVDVGWSGAKARRPELDRLMDVVNAVLYLTQAGQVTGEARIHHLKHRTTENTEFFSVLSRPSGKETKLNVS